jgi:hypothetical protein
MMWVSVALAQDFQHTPRRRPRFRVGRDPTPPDQEVTRSSRAALVSHLRGAERGL